MKEVQVINFNDGNCLIIKFYDEEVCFDSLVQIVFHLGKEEYVLLDDILGYALEELKSHFCTIESLQILPELLGVEIGISQNEYYHRCSEDLPLDIPALKEIDGKWIGSKYSCFESKRFSTWVFCIGEHIYFKITPLHSFYDESAIDYKLFLQNYSILYEKKMDQEELYQCRKNINFINDLIS